MTSTNSKVHSGAIKNGQTNPPSLLLDKFNARRSTPDSEALASSDDEPDNHRPDHQPIIAAQKPGRRASWLNDTTTQSVNQPRKGSFASSTMSPTTSHPSTPSAESATWGTHAPQGSGGSGIGRGHNGPTSFPWSSGIWNTEGRKEPPSRLTEVLPSPTSTHPPSGSFSHDLSAAQRDPASNQPIPFAIPLHPTPKTYRSQSYSVGQLEPDAGGGVPGPATAYPGRGRPLQHAGLQHRPSRPSMLSEMSNDGMGLGKVKEVEDDDDGNADSPGQEARVQSNEAKTIELLARENAILRQQQMQSRLRPRAATTTTHGLGNGYGFQDPLREDSDYAIDELDEINELQDIAHNGPLARRLSEYGTAQTSRLSPYGTLENRKLENVKKAYWQSSLGFGGLADIPQSRRHSFADITTRQGSLSSIGDPLAGQDNNGQENLSPTDYQMRYQDNPSYSINDHGEFLEPYLFKLRHIHISVHSLPFVRS